jgi:hypothetical protein
MDVRNFYCYLCSALCILCTVLLPPGVNQTCTVLLPSGVNQMCSVLLPPGVNQMCTVQLPPGVNPIPVKYISIGT